MGVVAGAPDAVDGLERELLGRGVASRRLRTSHAFHSRLMAPVAERLVESVRRPAGVCEVHLPLVIEGRLDY